MSALELHRERIAKSANKSRVALQGLFFIAIIAALYLARDFLLPVVLALFMALTLRPAVRFLEKYLVPPWLAASVFVIVLISAAASTLYLLSEPISEWIEQAPQLQQKFASKFAGLGEVLKKFSNLTDQIQNASTPALGAAVQEVVVREHSFPGLLVSMTSYPIQFMVTLAATVVLAVFLLASGDLFYQKLVRILPNLSARKQALHIVYSIESEVSTYVLTLCAINAALGLAVALTFQALGMPSPFLWGILVFVVNFVPYIGALSALILISFFAIISFDSVGYAIFVSATFLGWSLVESEIVQPQVLGRKFEMNAVVILLSLAFWSWLWGIAGAAIAVPVLITLKIFCSHMDGLAGIGEFLSSGHTETEDANSKVEN